MFISFYVPYWVIFLLILFILIPTVWFATVGYRFIKNYRPFK